MVGCGSIDSPMDMNTKLLREHEELLEHATRYMSQKIDGKTELLTVIRPDVTFIVSVVS